MIQTVFIPTGDIISGFITQFKELGMDVEVLEVDCQRPGLTITFKTTEEKTNEPETS